MAPVCCAGAYVKILYSGSAESDTGRRGVRLPRHGNAWNDKELSGWSAGPPAWYALCTSCHGM